MTGGRAALVVAIDRYDDASLQELAAPAADAEALREVLGDPDLGGFDVEVVHNRPSWAIYEKVEALLAGRRSHDLALIHFSCHGANHSRNTTSPRYMRAVTRFASSSLSATSAME